MSMQYIHSKYKYSVPRRTDIQLRRNRRLDIGLSSARVLPAVCKMLTSVAFKTKNHTPGYNNTKYQKDQSANVCGSVVLVILIKVWKCFHCYRHSMAIILYRQCIDL